MSAECLNNIRPELCPRFDIDSDRDFGQGHELTVAWGGIWVLALSEGRRGSDTVTKHSRSASSAWTTGLAPNLSK
ncbi:hypothetical protein PM082_016616 [Marasmius tenuissimus]|nr:hypothetical protein PM082_016616 [Marasmius tenuissimus]